MWGRCMGQVCGVRTQVCGVRTQVCGVRTQVCGVRRQVCGMRRQVCTVRTQVCGTQYNCGSGLEVAGLAIQPLSGVPLSAGRPPRVHAHISASVLGAASKRGTPPSPHHLPPHTHPRPSSRQCQAPLHTRMILASPITRITAGHITFATITCLYVTWKVLITWRRIVAVCRRA